MKILLVEDNVELLAVTSELLEAMGHHVDGVSNAEAALAKHGEEFFDLLVTDYQLPGIDGLELIRRWAVPIPTVVATSHADHPEIRRAAEKMGLEVVAKPYSVEELNDAMAAALRAGPRTSLQAQIPIEPEVPSELPELVQGLETPPPANSTRWAVACAGLLCAALLGLVLVPRLDLAPPPVPEPPAATDTRRGQILDVLEPMGPLVERPHRLEWRAVDRASIFVAWLEGVDGRMLWRGETPKTSIDLPADARQSLAVGVAYFWVVEALDARGARVARSERTRFRVIQPLEEER